jgi:TetR/AcrR family transcriptional regulator, copper-responsive repressor
MEQQRNRGGRPRGFDMHQALDRAVGLFWAHGYDGTSIALLSETLGIAPPSLYAAFGAKQDLYLLAVARYLEGPAVLMQAALENAPMARAAIERVLRDAAEQFTRPGHPGGCMVAGGLLGCAPDQSALAARMAGLRAAAVAGLGARFEDAVRSGELPASVDPAALARFYYGVIQGLSTQARDGATRAMLEAVADIALSAWPGR